MRPMGKPKPGFEERFDQIFRILQGKEKDDRSFMDKLFGRKAIDKQALLQEWFAIQIPSYETIKAPRVGRDAEADEWIRNQYEQTDKAMSEADFIKQHEDFYVIELAKEPDGVPMYISFQQDENVFRGKFMEDCEDIIGKKLVGEAWDTKSAAETLDYGVRLMEAADRVALKHNLQYLKTQRNVPDTEPESMESKLHIVYSLASWLLFYGKNGHGYEADF